MKTYHIVNGDCLADQLKQTIGKQDLLVCRECLIDGEVFAESLVDFWAVRSKFICNTYGTSTEEYYHKTVKEFEKIQTLPNPCEVCLWFENDLFCQANMWFVISLLVDRPGITIFRIFPTVKYVSDLWKGFGNSSAEMLEQSYSSKVLFKRQDLALGNNLWTAYKNHDFKQLKELSKVQSNGFQYLKEVCQAHIDRFPTNPTIGRPEKAIKEILATKSPNFQEVFAEFSLRQGIYGFGDTQVKSMYDNLIRNQ